MARGCAGGLGRRLSLRKVAGAYPINAALYSALAHAKGGGDSADGVPVGKCSDDRAVGVVGGCGLDGGAGGGCLFGAAADGGGGDAWQVVKRRLCVVVAVCVGGAGELAAVGRVPVFSTAYYVRGLSAGGVQDMGQRARLVTLFVAGEGGSHAGPCLGCYGLRVVRGAYPLRIGCASGGLGAVLDGPRHADQHGVLGFSVHGFPLVAGCCGGLGGSVRLFQADGKLGAAAGFGELCDGGAVQAPRLPHDLAFTHGGDLLFTLFDGAGPLWCPVRLC